MPWPILTVGETYEVHIAWESAPLRGMAVIVALDRGGGGRPSKIEVAGERRVLNNRQLLTAIMNARRPRRRGVWRD
jgi:hypothetical protein